MYWNKIPYLRTDELETKPKLYDIWKLKLNYCE